MGALKIVIRIHKTTINFYDREILTFANAYFRYLKALILCRYFLSRINTSKTFCGFILSFLMLDT